MSQNLITVRGLSKKFRVGLQQIQAVDNVDLDIRRGEILGLAGESGCGKSTLGQCLLRLIDADAGSIHFEDKDLRHLPKAEMRALRPRMQMVFQNPYASLNPRMTIEDIVAEPLDLHRQLSKSERRGKVLSLLEQVGLDGGHLSRYPHEFSGGQRQRISIARAIALKPDFIVCDEALSALDVSVQAQIVELLQRLQETHQLTYLFIAHDLSMLHYLCDRLAIMHQGQIVETGAANAVMTSPKHSYTKELLEGNQRKLYFADGV